MKKLAAFDFVILGYVTVMSLVVVLFREKARRSQDKARQSMNSVEQLAQVLRRRLGHAVDVPGDGPDFLGHPRRRRPGRRRQRPAEGTGRAREDERGAGRGGLFQQMERAGSDSKKNP